MTQCIILLFLLLFKNGPRDLIRNCLKWNLRRQRRLGWQWSKKTFLTKWNLMINDPGYVFKL